MQADSGVTLQMLKVDGGMTENDLLMQFQVSERARTLLACLLAGLFAWRADCLLALE